MTLILEELKLRLAEAHKRLAETTQRLQSAQQAHQSAQTEFNIWNGAVQTETRDEQLRAESASKNQLPLPNAELEPVPPLNHAEQSGVPENSEPVNKTGIVRELLRRHPSGMSPSEIWREVGDQFKYRAYLYSVLKRLRDRDEVMMRRKKYALKVQPEVNHPPILQ